MDNLNIQLIAFPEAGKEVFERGENILKSKLDGIEFVITKSNPDALLILTGGSENEAKSILADKKQILILALTENNSYAAASEIKAFCNLIKTNSILYNIDIESDINSKLVHYIKCKRAIQSITNYKIGLIGNVSEWLIASDIDRELIKNKLGILLEQINWNEFPEYNSVPANAEFINHFGESTFDLEDSSKVYNLLTEIKNQRNLSAITVECFPLVREHAVTACLALSQFNRNGFPAGCEGDITSIVGKIIVKELTQQIPWMANLVAIEDHELFLAHCTIATDLVSDFKIKTHFETNKGTAVQGYFKSDEVTVLRFNNTLDKAFVSFGKIVERPERDDSCRTQIKINLPKNDLEKLKVNPLGNHHLIIPGNYSELLHYYCNFMKIELV